MEINKNSLSPIYQQISDYLEAQIRKEVYKVGMQIPTEVELMQQFSVSRITVRLAIKDLLEKGLVEKKQGKGTFVKNTTFYHRLEGFKGLYETLLAGGVMPETELIEFDTVEATQEIARAFGISKGELVLRVLRVYYIDQTPVALAQISLHPRFIDLITLEEARNYPILELAAKKSGCSIGKAHFEIFSESAPKRLQKVLQIGERAAVLGSERVLYSENSEPIEHTLLWFRSDSYRFTLDYQGETNFKLSEVKAFHAKKKKED